RLRGCATVERLQDGRLDLDIAAPIEKRADGRGHARTGKKERADLGMYGEVSVPLPVSLLGVGEAGVPDHLTVDHLFLTEWKRTERFRQHVHRVDANGRLARSRPEHRPLRPDHVANVEE